MKSDHKLTQPTRAARLLGYIYALAFAGAIFCAGCIHIVFHSQFSETAMVRLSYGWLPLAVFGLTGLLLKDKASLFKAIGAAGVSVVLLAFFLIAIFPKL